MITLERCAYTPIGTFGQIIMPEFTCYTVERPWADNKPRESCIPCGEYSLARDRYHRGGYDCYTLQGVPNRTLIKIHVGNTMDDLLGCIAPGRSLGCVYGKWAVTSSRDAFGELMQMLDAMGGNLSLRVCNTEALSC